MKNIKDVKNSLKSICLETKHMKIKDPKKMPKFWINNHGCFALDKREVEHFYETAVYIRNNFDNGNLTLDTSKKDIESFLIEFISKTINLDTEKEKKESIDNFEIEFKKQISSKIREFEIISPILDLKISSNFTFGKLSFYTFTKYQLNKELSFIRNLYKKNNSISENEKNEWIKIHIKELSMYLNQTMIRCEINGTTTAAQLKSYNNALMHINVLKFIIYDITNNKPSKKEINTNKDFETIMKSDNLFRTTEYLPIELNFNFENSKTLKNNEAVFLSKILKKETKDDIDNRILASINWAVKSIEEIPTESDKTNFYDSSVYMTPNKHILSQCLLNIVIALETLLIFKDERNRKQELLKYRSIALLEKTDSKSELVKEQINKAYDLRSEIVHEGKFNNTTKAIYQLYFIFRDIVFELIKLKNKDNIEENHQLKKWFIMKESHIRFEENKLKFYEAKESNDIQGAK
ncbi:MAG: HEPN domain-containing protein [Candidatus Cloacimonetes bacterium]|nr:HEPN domain-containing protein [Candidatus Cloacimonadota bacterium]